MGYFAHDVVLVTGGPDMEEKVSAFRDSLPEEWRKLVVGPVPSVVNFESNYVFLPDGSKEGWPTSDQGDKYRREFTKLFQESSQFYGDVLTVRFGGDYRRDVGISAGYPDPIE